MFAVKVFFEHELKIWRKNYLWAGKNYGRRINRILTSYLAVSISAGNRRASGTIIVSTLPRFGSFPCLVLRSIPEGPATPFLGGRIWSSCASIDWVETGGSFFLSAFRGGVEPIIIFIFRSFLSFLSLDTLILYRPCVLSGHI